MGQSITFEGEDMTIKRKNQDKQQSKKTENNVVRSEKARKQEGRWKKQKEIIITVLAAFILIVLVAAGLWKLSGAGNEPADKLVFTVGQEEVYLDEVNLCILQNVVNLEITTDSLENTTAQDGSEAAEYYKQEILELIRDYKVEYMVAKKQGIVLTEEEEKSIRSDAVQFVGNISGTILNQLGITQDCVTEVFKQRYLAKKLEDDVKDDVTVEKQNYATMYMLLFPKVEMTENGDYKRQEDGETPVMLSEEKIAQRKKEADAAYEELLDGAKIEDVANQYGVSAFSGEESNLAESFGTPFSEYAQSLKENEYSPVLETESCYAILKMIEVNNQDLADQIMSYYKADLEKEKITEKKKQWYEETGVSEELEFAGSTWKAISLYDFTKFMEE